MNIRKSLTNKNVCFLNKVYEKDLETIPSKHTVGILMRIDSISKVRDKINQELLDNIEIVKENILENNQKELKKDIEDNFINR